MYQTQQNDIQQSAAVKGVPEGFPGVNYLRWNQDTIHRLDRTGQIAGYISAWPKRDYLSK